MVFSYIWMNEHLRVFVSVFIRQQKCVAEGNEEGKVIRGGEKGRKEYTECNLGMILSICMHAVQSRESLGIACAYRD